MKISIAMCTYNGATFLQEQLESIAMQSRQPDELIICDDCSTDTTIEIIELFKKKCNFQTKIYKNAKNLGSTKNFEQAIMLCDGDIIFLADQDDIWFPEKINRVLLKFQKSPDLSLIFTNAEVVDERKNPLGYTLWDSIDFKQKDAKQLSKGNGIRVLLNRNVATGATMAFKSTLRNFIVPISEKWVHDAWITFLITSIGGTGFINESLIEYRRHSNQQIGCSVVNDDVSLKMKRLGNALKENKKPVEFDFSPYLLIVSRLNELCEKGFINNDSINKVNAELKWLKEKLKFIEKRSLITGSGFSRFPVVYSHLLEGNYHKYSSGFYSAFKDLIHR
jgi:glycosyltransferase involved in cell wall biosynthesis